MEARNRNVVVEVKEEYFFIKILGCITYTGRVLNPGPTSVALSDNVLME